MSLIDLAVSLRSEVLVVFKECGASEDIYHINHPGVVCSDLDARWFREHRPSNVAVHSMLGSVFQTGLSKASEFGLYKASASQHFRCEKCSCRPSLVVGKCNPLMPALLGSADYEIGTFLYELDLNSEYFDMVFQCPECLEYQSESSSSSGGMCLVYQKTKGNDDLIKLASALGYINVAFFMAGKKRASKSLMREALLNAVIDLNDVICPVPVDVIVQNREGQKSDASPAKLRLVK